MYTVVYQLRLTYKSNKFCVRDTSDTGTTYDTGQLYGDVAVVPRVLVTCGHTFCAGCLDTMLEPPRMRNGGCKKLECPTCRVWSAGCSEGWRRACQELHGDRLIVAKAVCWRGCDKENERKPSISHPFEHNSSSLTAPRKWSPWELRRLAQ